APHLVRDYKTLAVVKHGNPFLPASRGWITRDRTEPGHIGSPHLASAEKGETLLATFSDGVQKMVQRMTRWDGKSWEG
ncbi:MAG: creatininase family protein, partial [Planctomycetota bacterium]|nr:creatininase family protein [Planctomycetota bacterium]